MHSIMVWKNSVCFSLFCLLQRWVAWVTAFYNPTYCDQKWWVKKTINQIYAMVVGRFRDSKPPHTLQHQLLGNEKMLLNLPGGLSQKCWVKKNVNLTSSARFIAVLLALLFIGFVSVAQAAAPTYQAQGTASSGTGALTPMWPTHQTDDIALLIVETANQAVTLSSNAAGFVEVASSPQGTGTAAATTATRLTVFWTRATSNAMANPTVADSGDHQTAQIVTFRGVFGTGNPWDVTVGDVLSTASTSFSIPGATTTVTNSLVVAIIAAGIDSSTTNQRSGWTNASLTGLTERLDSNTSSGNGGGFGVATGVKTTAGTYNSTTGTLAANSVQGRISIALKPKTTTLGDGANPANVTIAPSAAITDLDAFTLQTSSGTDSLTALTVTLTGTNSFQALTEVRITSNDGATTYFSAVANPAGNTVSFSGGTPILVTSSATTFKVRITPKTHANMPVPPGLSYTAGGTVTAFTGTNEQLGSDGTSAAVIVDNLSPAGATAVSGSAGNAKTTLNWTSSAATDFNITSGSVVYRWAAGTAGSEVPIEGSTASVGGTNGAATVVCVVSSAASAALVRIDGTGGGTDCTTTALTNGQAYTYKIFQKDANGNYDVGVALGTFTPAVTTIADGTNPANSTIAPGAAITDLDAFTLKTDAGTDTVTAVTVTLSPAGAFNNIAQVDLTDNSNLARCTAVTNPTSNTIAFSTCNSNGGIPATTSVTTYKVRITPKTHANMDAPPGASYATTGTVTSFTSTKSQAGTDTASATITVDNASPASATAASGNSDDAKITLNWTTSAAADFVTTSGSVVYRWAAGTAGSQVPTEGSAPAKGDTNGTATVACVVSSAASTALVRTDGSGGSADCTTIALTNGQAYTYKVFQKDSNGNYDVGVVVGTITPAVVNCTSQASGNWSALSTWTNCRGGIPLAGDGVTIASSHNVTLNVNTPSLTTLTINSGGTLTNTGSNTITLTSNMSNAGTYSGGSGAVTVGGSFINTGSYSAGSATTTLTGNFSNSGTFTANTGTWVFSGSSAQSLTGVTGFNNLTVNNVNGVSLNNNVSVSTLLVLTNGHISTSSNILILSANCNVPGWSRGSGFVSGNVRLTFPTASSPGVSCTYPVGDGASYTPISLTMASAGGTLTGSTTGHEHPAIAFSTIDPTLDANRYWTLGATGDTVIATSYGVTVNFQTGDLDINAVPANFIVGQYASGVWTMPTSTSGTSFSTASNISGPITIPTDFTVGQIPVPCTAPSGLPSNMTCVCDNFGRSNLNPSTIYGADWLVDNKNQSSTFGNPRIVNSGKLQLTDLSGGVSTVANVPGTFPAAGNLIVVEFKHYAYKGSGADGIALTLSDSTKTPTPGAFGGSLGYAPKDTTSDCSTAGGCPGFNGGWVGIAIDEFGNFSANTEGRTGGSAPGQRADSVSVRGSGSGLNGYPYLGGSATLSPGVDNAGSTTAAYGHQYRITVDARCYLNNNSAIGCVNPSLNKTTSVKVERDTTGSGASYTAVVSAFDTFTVNPSQADVPTNWKLSFTGSTGGSNNIHEISGLKVCAQTITPPAGYRIQVDNLSPSVCTTAVNGKTIVTVTALDNSGNTLTGYTSPVTLTARIDSSSGSVSGTTTWTSLSGNHGTWDGANKRYTFDTNDHGVAQFQLTDSVTENIYIVVSEFVSGSTLASSLITPVQFSGGAFSVSALDSLNTGVVAGRPHLMRITRTNGCGTDTTYSGLKTLDSWYTPITFDHPAGAIAPQICATNASGNCQPAGGSCQVQSIAPPAVSSSSNNLIITFVASGVNAGTADFCLVTSDVGKYTISVRDDSNTSLPITGSGSTLTARPLALYFNNATKGFMINPMTTTSSGTRFIPAGDTFEGTVSAVLWTSALDPGYTGTPTVTPQTDAADWTAALVSRPPAFAWPTTLSIASVVSPSGGSGILSGSSTSLAASAYTSGHAVLPVNSLSIDNVGSFLLTEAVSNYLNTSGTAVPGYSDVIGRFYLDHFEVSGGAVNSFCNGYTYMGQPNLGITFTVTAKNKNNGSASNYAMTPNVSLVAEDQGIGNTGYNLGSRISGAPGAWNADVYSVNTSTAIFSRPSTLGLITGVTADASGSFDKLQIGVQTSDADGAKIQGLDMRATTQGACTTAASVATDCDAKVIGTTTRQRLGRISLQNAYGSELLDLAMPLTAEYWDGSNWVKNIDDICTAGIALSAAVVTGPIATLCAWDTGAPGSSGLGCSVAGTSVNKFSQPPVTDGGNFNLNFQAPGAGNTGAMDITARVPSYLKFNWQGGGDTDPTARATFGIYKGNSKFIYIRELY